MSLQKRERLVVVGSGWVGLYFAQYIDTKKYHVSIISPSRTSPYTPLLASAAVAIIPFRYAEESVRSKGRDVSFLEANVTAVDMHAKSVSCEAAFPDDEHLSERKFSLKYDKLILSPGCEFGILHRSGCVGY
jgi:NADH dehydrogenase FAD-containing subunit